MFFFKKRGKCSYLRTCIHRYLGKPGRNPESRDYAPSLQSVGNMVSKAIPNSDRAAVIENLTSKFLQLATITEVNKYIVYKCKSQRQIHQTKFSYKERQLGLQLLKVVFINFMSNFIFCLTLLLRI